MVGRKIPDRVRIVRVEESRKYSTGTKGRLKMHADHCRAFIHANAPGFSLGNEFIETIDPEREDKVWQRFQEPGDILPELRAWLDGDTPPPEESASGRGAMRASELEKNSALPEEWRTAVNRIRHWITSPEGEKALEFQSPSGAAELVLERLEKALASIKR